MGTPALVVVRFGLTQVHFRRHSHGSPEITGLHLLDLLESAQSLRPREHMHTGSYFLRLIFDAGFRDKPLSKKMRDQGALPIFEAVAQDEWDNTTSTGDPSRQDWEYAYEFNATPSEPHKDDIFVERDDIWTISFVEGCQGEPWSELAKDSRQFSVEAFRAFVEERADR